jgi:RES domain-containing protein
VKKVKNCTNAVLKVPSIVIKEEHNFIINLLHADLKKIKLAQTVSFSTDKKLFNI